MVDATGCSLLEAYGMSLSSPNQQEYGRESARVRAALGEAAWRAAWAEGVKLAAEGALRLVTPAAPSAPESPGWSPAGG